MSATNVPTNGFITPPAGAPPAAAPVAPGGVPPAGPPPRGFNSAEPQQYVGQQPGFIPQVPVAPAAAPAAPAAQPDLGSIAAILQQALGQAAPALPAAPAAPVVEAVRPAWMPVSANAFDVATIKDPIIRSMATVMQSVGKDLDLDRILGRALTHGDKGLIDYAYIQEKGGANAASLVEIAKGIVDSVTAKSEAVTKAVYDAVGGEQNWSASVAAFNKGAPQELRLTVTQMLNSTEDNMITAGAKIVAEYGRASGLLPKIGAPNLNSASAGIQGTGLTRTGFQEELRKLNPNQRDYAEARQALFTRRSLGKAAGLQ